MEIPNNLRDDIKEYCRLNDISDINSFSIRMLRQGFTSEKYGPTPWDKPTEVKEVEVVKEIEIEVIKEVFITDDELNLELNKKISTLDDEIVKLKSEIESLEIENKKLKDSSKNDIYGEG